MKGTIVNNLKSMLAKEKVLRQQQQQLEEKKQQQQQHQQQQLEEQLENSYNSPQEFIDKTLSILEAARQERGMPKAELARRSGLTSAAVQMLMGAEGARPKVDTLVLLADTLGFDLVLQKRNK